MRRETAIFADELGALPKKWNPFFVDDGLLCIMHKNGTGSSRSATNS